MTKKLAICVPYRDREKHLKKFVPELTGYLSKKGIKHKIFICHQRDNKQFNRGKLKNIAFDIARKEGYDYFAFHDIDLLPDNDNCNYQYPEKLPVHLSTQISEYNYDLPYLENFGGCVIFTKEQFEKINGYYNEYWGWGIEDDDLYYRCMKHNLVDMQFMKGSIPDKNVIEFDGKSGYLEVNSTQSLNNFTSRDFSIAMLIKVSQRDDLSPYFISDKDRKYISVPILTQSTWEILTYSNVNSFESALWNTLEGWHGIWIRRDQELFTHIMLTYNHQKNELRFYLNGDEAGKTLYLSSESPVKIKGELIKNNCDNFYIGTQRETDKEVKTNDFFKGQIANICFWQKAFDSNEIKKIYQTADVDWPKEKMVLHYDFEKIEGNKVPDKSGCQNYGIIHNCKIKKTAIGRIITSRLPYRRPGRFNNQYHKKDGVANDDFVSPQFSKNEHIFQLEVKTGKINTDHHGLNNLQYKLLNIETIDDYHSMINVEC